MQSVIPKILDRLITDKLYHHLDCLLPSQQHGFRAKRSTTTNLLEKTQYIFQHFKAATCIDVIYFDYTKAFDQVDHGILAKKLLSLSTPAPLFRVIMSFITNRTYQLKADGQAKDELFATMSSVPQGSHCGPVLFLILCSDIATCVRNTNVKLSMYADDITFLKAIYNDDDRKHLQQSIDQLDKWTRENFLQMNAVKTVHVSYTRSKTRKTYNHYYIQRTCIATQEIVKDLGVTFNTALTFKHHIEDVATRANNVYATGNRFAKEIRQPKIMISITKSFILPIVEFCSVVWSQDRIIISLEKTLHNSTRAQLATPYDNRHADYITFEQRMNILGLLTYRERRIITSTLTIIKIVRGDLITTLSDTVEEYRHVVLRVTRNANIFDFGWHCELPPSSPLRMGMANVNAHRDVFTKYLPLDASNNQLQHQLNK